MSSVKCSSNTSTLSAMLTIGLSTTINGWLMDNGPTCNAAWTSSAPAIAESARA